MDNIDGCVFIVTYGRSGSTLLQRIMQTIPGMCFRGENSGTLDMLFQSAKRASATRYEFGQWKLPPQHPWHGADLIYPDKYSKALAQVFIDEIINPGPEQRWVGFKEIRYHELGIDFFPLLDWINETFPNPYFLFNTRNLDDVVKSAWWAEEEKTEVIKSLEQMDKRFMLYHRKRPDRCFINNYAQLIDNPKSIKPFFRKMGLRFDSRKVRQIMQERLTH